MKYKPVIKITKLEHYEYFHCTCCFQKKNLNRLSFKREVNKRTSGGTSLFICDDCVKLLKIKIEELYNE